MFRDIYQGRSSRGQEFEFGGLAWTDVVSSSGGVVKFFEDQLQLVDHERLNHLLDTVNAEGMEDINKMYQTILNITYTSNAKSEWHASAQETFRWVIGFIIVLKEPLPIGNVGAFLDLRRSSTSDQVDILHFTTNLRTVLVAGTGEITKDTIPRLHKLFITSDEAVEQFRIDVDAVNVEIALTMCAVGFETKEEGRSVGNTAW
jgi:plasmid maintenance system antidote protein VapI